MLNVAIPPDRVPVPIVVEPSLNATVPLGVPAVEDTTAVNVTDWPNVDGFSDDDRVVVVLANGIALTTCESASEVLPASFVSPPYTAVMK